MTLDFGWGCMESQIAFRRLVVSVRLIFQIREPGQSLQLWRLHCGWLLNYFQLLAIVSSAWVFVFITLW